MAEALDMAEAPKWQGTVLAFDFGTRQIGLASGQTITATASPQANLPARDGVPDWEHLEALIREWRPALLLVGLPLNMDGSESALCARARKFARRLHGRTGKPVLMVDERLSTHEAKGLEQRHDPGRRGNSRGQGGRSARGRNPGVRRESYREQPVDAIAACLILESWLGDHSLGQPP